MPGIFDGDVQCDSVLAATEINSQQDSMSVRLAWLKTINESNYSQNKAKGNVLVPGYFDGSYADFSAKRDELIASSDFNLTVLQYRQSLLIRPANGAVQAWESCIRDKISAGTLACWVTDANRKSATLCIRWRSGPGLGPLREIKHEVENGEINGFPLAEKTTLDGFQSFIVRRNEDNGYVRGTIHGKAGIDGDFECNFYLPPIPDPPVRKDWNSGPGDGSTALLELGGFDKSAFVYGTAYGASQWERSGDPRFWVRLEGIPGQPPMQSDTIGVEEGKPPKTLIHNFSFVLPKGSSAKLKVTMWNEHAVSRGVHIDAVTIIG